MFGNRKRVQQLLETARRALDALKVMPDRGEEGLVTPLWDPRILPLEYRHWAITCVEQLVYYIYGEGAVELNSSRADAQALLESVAFLELALTDRVSIGNAAALRRQALRAQTLDRLIKSLNKVLADFKQRLIVSAPHSRDVLLPELSEAIGWFKTQEELDAAVSARGAVDRKQYPRVLLTEVLAAVAALRAAKIEPR